MERIYRIKDEGIRVLYPGEEVDLCMSHLLKLDGDFDSIFVIYRFDYVGVQGLRLIEEEMLIFGGGYGG